jgi:hypothetical protein
MGFFKIALKKFMSTKNIFTLITLFSVSVLIKLLFKYLEIKLFFESDIIYCFSSISTISIGSYIRKCFDGIDIPDIN